jgi:uncharacterized protein (TIGR03437 family)
MNRTYSSFALALLLCAGARAAAIDTTLTVAVPTITAVQDAASNTPNIAQGSIFIVKGSNLCPSGVKFFDIPRPTVSPDGIKITFTPTSGGAGTDALLWYLYNPPPGPCQLAGILPSTVAVGNYNVTVTNGSVSAPFASQVVQRKPALFTQDSTGGGLASVQNYIAPGVVDLNSFTTGTGKGTTISPAKPGQILLAYGTGLGPLVGGDNAASPAFDFNANGVAVRAIVGGVTLPVLYAGRAGYAGEDQINVALPSNIPTGCTVSFQLSVNGVLGNSTFIAIAPDASAAACVQPGFTTQQLKNFDNGGTYTTGAFSLFQFQSTLDTGRNVYQGTITGSFTRLTGFRLDSFSSQDQGIGMDSCQVIHTVNTIGQTSSGTVTGLDAGAIALTEPAGSSITNLALQQDPASNSYGAAISTPDATSRNGIVAGKYTLNGAGGKDVGQFNASLTLGPPLVVTGGMPSSITRSAGLTLNWTGGNASDLVVINGQSFTNTGSFPNSTVDETTFTCITTAGKGGFTVPASILNQMLAAVAHPITGGSSLIVVSQVSAPFAAPLTAGGSIDAGAFVASVGLLAAPVAYQ